MKTNKIEPVVNNIAHYMKKRKMTPVAFAKAMGVSYQTVNNWMSNRSQPKLENIHKAGEIFKINPKKLITFNITWDE